MKVMRRKIPKMVRKAWNKQFLNAGCVLVASILTKEILHRFTLFSLVSCMMFTFVMSEHWKRMKRNPFLSLTEVYEMFIEV